MENIDQQFEPLDHHHELRKQVEMYFDQALDPQSQQEFLQKVDSDPTYHKAFHHEKNIRDQIKNRIYRPVNSTQLVQAIKNQIHKSE